MSTAAAFATADLPPAAPCNRIVKLVARVAELADAADSKSADESRVGSIPTLGAIIRGELGGREVGWVGLQKPHGFALCLEPVFPIPWRRPMSWLKIN